MHNKGELVGTIIRMGSQCGLRVVPLNQVLPMGVLMSMGTMPSREKYTCMIYMPQFYTNSAWITKN